jgi:hypothetical protein
MESNRYQYWTEGAVHKASHGALRGGEKVSGGIEGPDLPTAYSVLWLRLLDEVTQDLNIWMSCYEDASDLIIGLDELFSGERLKSRSPSLLL